MFKTAEYGLRFTQRDYTFYTLEDAESDSSSEDENSTERRWVALADTEQLRSRTWPEDIEIELFVEGIAVVLDEERDEKAEQEEEEKLRPHLVFLSNGELLPDVELHLRSTTTEKAWRVGIGEEGLLALGPLEE